MAKRRRSREILLEILFQVDVGSQSHEDAYNYSISNNAGKDYDDRFLDRCLKDITENVNEIDEEIKKRLKNWRFDRIANIDRNILRFAIYEILNYDDIPLSVTINEAVEIAKKYGSEESAAFINGVLGTFESVKVDVL